MQWRRAVEASSARERMDGSHSAGRCAGLLRNGACVQSTSRCTSRGAALPSRQGCSSVRPVASRGDPCRVPPEIGRALDESGYHFRITRDLEEAKRYLRERYAEDPDARYGMIASSKDRDLTQFGIPNDFHSTKRVQNGPWFAAGDDDERGRSCRELRPCVTEFGCQGLELDATLLAWGTPGFREARRRTNRKCRGYERRPQVRDPYCSALDQLCSLAVATRPSCSSRCSGTSRCPVGSSQVRVWTWARVTSAVTPGAGTGGSWGSTKSPATAVVTFA